MTTDPGWLYTNSLTSDVQGRTKIPGDWTGDRYKLVANYMVSSDGSQEQLGTYYTQRGAASCSITTVNKVNYYSCGVPLVIPVVLCTLAALAGLVVPITVAMPRFAASIISFLTAMNIMNTVLTVLPSNSYFCWLIVWLICQMVLLCGLIIHTMVMYQCNKHFGERFVTACDKAVTFASVSWWFLSWGLTSLTLEASEETGYLALLIVVLVIYILAVLVVGRMVITSHWAKVSDDESAVAPGEPPVAEPENTDPDERNDLDQESNQEMLPRKLPPLEVKR